MVLSAAREDPGRKQHVSGTHRVVSPAHTLQQLNPLRRTLGITRVANITGLDRIGMPVVTVIRPNSRSLAVAQGKGIDLAAAKVSGMMEALECHHAEHVHRPLLFGSSQELADHHRLWPTRDLPRSGWQEFDPQRRIHWVEASHALSHDRGWLPLELVSADFTLPMPAGAGCFACNTNGLASGNHPLEALCHALCEVIERDATTLWKKLSADEHAASGLDLASVEDAACKVLLAMFEDAAIDVTVWDVTSDVGVPAFYCLICDAQHAYSDPEFGAGCHPCREIALLRALTEAAQARLTFIAGVRDDIGPECYLPAARARRERVCGALRREHQPRRRFADLPSFEAGDLMRDWEWLLGCVERAGLPDVHVVDLSRADTPFAVVKVVVPGLEGLDDDVHGGYVPGPRARRLMGLAP